MDEQQHKNYTKLVVAFMLVGGALAVYFAWFHYSWQFVAAVALVAHTWPLVFTRCAESHVLTILQWGPHAFSLYTGKPLPILLLLLIVRIEVAGDRRMDFGRHGQLV